MSHRTSTHITFSWKVVDGYHSSSNIEYFTIFYRERSGSISSISSISYSDRHLTVTGSSFEFNTTISSFNYGQYVMWVRAFRPSRTPAYSFSKQIYVELSRSPSVYTYTQRVHFYSSCTISITATRCMHSFGMQSTFCTKLKQLFCLSFLI